MDLTFAQPTYELSRLERRICRDFAEERPRQLAIAISDRKKKVYGATPNDRTRGPANIVAIAAMYFAGSSVRPAPPQPHDIVALQLLLGDLPFDRVQGRMKAKAFVAWAGEVFWASSNFLRTLAQQPRWHVPPWMAL